MAPGTQAQGRHRLCALGLSLSARSLLPALLRGPALLPLGREKPEGGVSQRKRETKNSSPGEQAQSQSFSAFALGSGPFLGCSGLLCPNPTTPLSLDDTVDPRVRRDQESGTSAPADTHPGSQAKAWASAARGF